MDNDQEQPRTYQESEAARDNAASQERFERLFGELRAEASEEVSSLAIYLCERHGFTSGTVVEVMRAALSDFSAYAQANNPGVCECCGEMIEVADGSTPVCGDVPDDDDEDEEDSDMDEDCP